MTTGNTYTPTKKTGTCSPPLNVHKPLWYCWKLINNFFFIFFLLADFNNTITKTRSRKKHIHTIALELENPAKILHHEIEITEESYNKESNDCSHTKWLNIYETNIAYLKWRKTTANPYGLDGFDTRCKPFQWHQLKTKGKTNGLALFSSAHFSLALSPSICRVIQNSSETKMRETEHFFAYFCCSFIIGHLNGVCEYLIVLMEKKWKSS